jgi:hypothetical protein
MSTFWTVLAAFPSLVEEGPAPEDVKAGWLGFAVFLALVAAVVILGLSLRKHLGRVKFDEAGEPTEPTEPTDPADKDQRAGNGSA